MYRLHVSRGNTKLGNIHSISLPPLVTCEPNPPCSKLCYARKAYEHYSSYSAKPAWDDNLAYYKAAPIAYFEEIRSYLATRRKTLRFFRWNVSGDVPDLDYFKYIMWIAAKFPETQFALYTRRAFILDEYEPGNLPINLEVRESVWINEQPRSKFAPFIVFDKDAPVHGAFVCPGNCSWCLRCYYPTKEPTYVRLH